MDYKNMETNQPTLEGNEISRHDQRFLFKVFMGNCRSHKEWTITIDLKQWHPMLHLN
jgi:hypothetical protein